MPEITPQRDIQIDGRNFIGGSTYSVAEDVVARITEAEAAESAEDAAEVAPVAKASNRSAKAEKESETAPDAPDGELEGVAPTA